MASQTKIGVIYADNPEAGAFDEGTLRQFQSIANLGSGGFEQTRYVEWLEGENYRLQQEIDLDHELIGRSPKTIEVYSFMQKAAATASNVMILGQSGTGKWEDSSPDGDRTRGPRIESLL